MRFHLIAPLLPMLLFIHLATGANAPHPATRASTAPSTPAPRNISSLLKPILNRHKIPSLFAARIDGNRVTSLGAFGVRKSGAPEPVTPNDQIHLGSDTKAMTAVLIGQLVDDGQLALDTPMSKIFPALAPKMNAAAAGITVSHLLNHTAGLPANMPDWWKYERSSKPLIDQRRRVASDALAQAPTTEPGPHFEYSNVGYVILGAVLEQKTGTQWETLVQKKLFGPLNMTSAGFGPPGETGKINQPWGHVAPNMRPMQFDNPAVMGPAGRVHCTMIDWAKFIALFVVAPKDRAPLLKPETFDSLFTPAASAEYAGGWMFVKRGWGDGIVLNHNGSNTMWYCTAWISPKKHFAVLAATNIAGDDAAKACDEAASALILGASRP